MGSASRQPDSPQSSPLDTKNLAPSLGKPNSPKHQSTDCVTTQQNKVEQSKVDSSISLIGDAYSGVGHVVVLLSFCAGCTRSELQARCTATKLHSRMRNFRHETVCIWGLQPNPIRAEAYIYLE